jgi:hypothetical protein
LEFHVVCGIPHARIEQSLILTALGSAEFAECAGRFGFSSKTALIKSPIAQTQSTNAIKRWRVWVRGLQLSQDFFRKT